MQYNISNNEKGFSLIELMVVLVIVGIMAGMAIPNIGGFMAGQEITEAAQNVAGALRSARGTAISKNVRTVVVISDDDTTTGRIYVIYRQLMPGEPVPAGAATKVSNGITCYQIAQGNISPKGQIGMNTNALLSGAAISHYKEISFTSTGTSNGGTIYLQPDKEFNANKNEKMRAITVVNATGRVRIYQWGGSSWY